MRWRCLCGADGNLATLATHRCEYWSERMRIAPHGIYIRGIRVDNLDRNNRDVSTAIYNRETGDITNETAL